MDSVTQITLGASVAALASPAGFRRRALLWGAAVGTLPDLDVLVPLGDPVSDFTYHRGASHSFFFMTLATPLLAGLGFRVHRGSKAADPNSPYHRSPVSYRRWCLMIWLVLITHALLDCFTVYGTQVFLPFSNQPVGWATIFIIDPLYTLPLLIGVFWLAFRPKTRTALRALKMGLVLSTAYLAWTVSAKAWMTTRAAHHLERQGVEAQRLLVMPSAFNSLAWRVLAMTEQRYFEGFISVLSPDRLQRLTDYSQSAVPAPVEAFWALRRLSWFAGGFARFEIRGDDFVVTDLRMGTEPWYVFSFAVSRREDGEWREVRPEQLQPGPPPDRALTDLWTIITGQAPAATSP